MPIEAPLSEVQGKMWVLAMTQTVSVSWRTTLLTLTCFQIGGNCKPIDPRSRMSLWHGNMKKTLWHAIIKVLKTKKQSESK